MFIVIHCSGMPFNGTTVENSSLGGSETAAFYMAKELVKEGHKVTIFTNSKDEGIFDKVRYVFLGEISRQYPLGNLFHYYAENTPSDVMIIQRHPAAFAFNWASKINLWWVHDLALYSMRPYIENMLWNIDGILTVSEFHKNQYVEVYGLSPDIVMSIQNGVDLRLFKGEIEEEYPPRIKSIVGRNDDVAPISLLYSSRPERGLEHLVAPDGIMDKLGKIDEKYHLYVCAYDNVTAEMKGYYEYLTKRCKELPNVTILGTLTKQELADVMRQCDAMVYPTPGPHNTNFEEVSCITAMECMAAGLPFISSDKGALSETCHNSGSVLIPLKDSMVDIDLFVENITYYANNYIELGKKGLQREAAKKYSWPIACGMLLEHINFIFDKKSEGAVCAELMRSSDIYALDRYFELMLLNEVENDYITKGINDEMNSCYSFAFEEDFKDHYAKYYEYEKNRGVEYGPEKLDGNLRFEHVSSLIQSLSSGAVVLDYGCAHGHYTINLADRFPHIDFIGIDIAKSNIEKARSWAEQEKIVNADFILGEVDSKNNTISLLEQKTVPLKFALNEVDTIIAAEVLEHVADPIEHVKALMKCLKPNGEMIITVPYGPWEAQGYEEHHPWRAHLWHFEREDLHDIFSDMPEFKITCVPGGHSKFGTSLGSYVVSFRKGEDSGLGHINTERKIDNTMPMQTISLCMIIKNAEATLKRSLDSIGPYVNEVILAIDKTTTDGSHSIIDNWIQDRKGNWPIVRQFSIDPAIDIGFDEARNLSIKQASCDWIMWLDSDEIIVHGERIYKYLRNNQYSGYALKQNHFTAEPMGLIKVDLPCRIFRNNEGIKFFGVVHEHPEKKINEGVGFVRLINGIEIVHEGYTTEDIRRNRFNRNIELLVRDRKKYPERLLGKFLWIRDLSQMCRYSLEQNGNIITKDMVNMSKEGIALWEDLLESRNERIIIDSLEFYTVLCRILNIGFEISFSVETSKSAQIDVKNIRTINCRIASKEYAEKLFEILLSSKTCNYNSTYN